MNFLTTSNGLRRTYREAGFDRTDADRLARGQTLIAKVENATTTGELQDVLRDLIRDLYDLGHPVPPHQSVEAVEAAREAARKAR